MSAAIDVRLRAEILVLVYQTAPESTLSQDHYLICGHCQTSEIGDLCPFARRLCRVHYRALTELASVAGVQP